MNTCASFTPSSELMAQVTARRGRLHAFEHLEPARTALLVVDMQNSFVRQSGHAWVPAAAATCPTINRTAQALRELGGQVVWVLNTFTEDSLQSWSHFHQELWSTDGVALRSASMCQGSEGHALYADLRPALATCICPRPVSAHSSRAPPPCTNNFKVWVSTPYWSPVLPPRCAAKARHVTP